jgi:hypothetical protein
MELFPEAADAAPDAKAGVDHERVVNAAACADWRRKVRRFQWDIPALAFGEQTMGRQGIYRLRPAFAMKRRRTSERNHLAISSETPGFAAGRLLTGEALEAVGLVAAVSAA